MILGTLKSWGKGAVTLPKKWREKYETKHYMAREAENGDLVISPIEVEYREDKIAGNFGLHFPKGIPMSQFIKIMDEFGRKEHGEEAYNKALAEARLERKKKAKKQNRI